MKTTPESEARQAIDAMLTAAGWLVQDMARANIHAGPGVAVREFPLKTGHGFADYLLFVQAQAVGVLEAKKAGTTLTGVEVQAEKYSVGHPDDLPAPIRPLPFCYQSTGVETRFTNLLDLEPCSRPVFAVHRPETLATWLAADPLPGATCPSSLRARLQALPCIPMGTGLWGNQVTAVTNLEASLALSRPRALIQMATGSGKSLTAAAAVYRMATNPDLRQELLTVKRSTEQVYDTKTVDELTHAGVDKLARSQAETLVTSFRAYIDKHKDEITALQVIYNTSSRRKLDLSDLEDLAARISQAIPGAVQQARPGDYDVHPLWAAFAKLEASRVKGKGGRHLLTDLITLVRHAVGQVPDLEPFADQVGHHFDQWLERQQAQGSDFTEEQVAWLHAIRDQIASSLSMEREDFREDPFSRMGGLGKARAVFGERLDTLVDEMNRELVA